MRKVSSGGGLTHRGQQTDSGCERNRRVGWDALTCLLGDRAVDADLPGQNQRAGPLSRAGQGSFD